MPTRYALKQALDQFAIAYGLEKEPSLAAAFDAWLQPKLHSLRPHVRFPPAFGAATAGLRDPWTPENQRLAEAVAFSQWVSDRMEEHFRARERALARDPALTGFIRCFCDNSIFSSREELEVQLAIGGSYAATQQAAYSEYRNPKDLDAIAYVSMGLYSPVENAKRAEMLKLVSPVVDRCSTKAGAGNFTRIDDPANHAIRLYWGEKTIAPFIYRPLAVEIAGKAPPARPLLSWVWNLPMLGLPDLVREFRHMAAEIEEFGRSGCLRQTSGALADIMMSAANPEPANPAIAALRDYRCNNLMISGSRNASGSATAYPRSYYV